MKLKYEKTYFQGLKFSWKVILIILGMFFFAVQYSNAQEWGKNYEQQVATSGTAVPGLQLSPGGSTTLLDSETLKIVASPSGANYTPHYYWQSTGGQLIGQSSERTIKWKPPSVSGNEDFYVFCTLQDGKGHAVTEYVRVTVSHDGGTSGGGTDLVDPEVSNVRIDGTSLKVDEPTTIYWTATDSQTPDSQLKIWLQYSTDGSNWENINTDAPNSGEYSWTPQTAGNNMSARVCAVDNANNHSYWRLTPGFNVQPADAIEPPSSTYINNPGTETPNTSIQIKWRKIIGSDNELNVDYYELEYADNVQLNNAQHISPIYDNSDPGNIYSTSSYTVTNLQDNTRYYFKVRGVNSVAPGPWSLPQNILVNLEHWPAFDESYQEPAHNASGVSKAPILRWRATDADNDDTLDYYVTLGTDPNQLDSIRAFNKDGYQGQSYFDFSDEYHDLLRPNTTYFWQVKVKEGGKDKAYYDGEYIHTPVWQFTTVSEGSDLAVTSVVLDGTVSPGATVNFKATVRNLGTETANRASFKAVYIKEGSESPFWNCSGYMSADLAPGAEEIVDVEIKFRTDIWESGGVTYDNILVSGDSQVKFLFNWNDEQDVNWDNNSFTLPIHYEDAGGPVIDYFDLREYGSMYENWLPEFWARMGRELRIVVQAHDDIMVARFVVQQRFHQADAWVTIHDQTNESEHLTIIQEEFGNGSSSFIWPVPTGIETTNDAQFKILLYDDNDNLTERESEPFPIYSNRVEASIQPVSGVFKVGETLSFNANFDGDNTVTHVTVKLIYGSRADSDIFLVNDDNGVTVSNPVQWSIPENNIYASENCYLEFHVSDNRGNGVDVRSERFRIVPNQAVPAPFNESVVIYTDEFQFPTGAFNTQQKRLVKFVKVDDNNLVHAIVEHSYSYFLNTAANYDADTFVYRADTYYVTYDITSGVVSGRILVCDKNFQASSLEVINTVPYVLLKSRVHDTMAYTLKSGSSFTAPVSIENTNVPRLSGIPTLQSSSSDVHSLSEPQILHNGYLWDLDIFTTRIYRSSFNNGTFGSREYYSLNNNETLGSYRVKPVASGDYIYYISHSQSKLAQINISSRNVQSFALPFSTTNLERNKCNVALSLVNNRLFLFGNGRVYELVNGSFIERGPIAYTFDGDTCDYSGSHWNDVNYIKALNVDGKPHLIINGSFFWYAKPKFTSTEILEYDVSTFQFTKKIVEVNGNLHSEFIDDIWVNGIVDLLYIGNNRVLGVFAHELSDSSGIYHYSAALKMLDLETGDIRFLGSLPLKSSGPVSLHMQNGNIYVLAENRGTGQTDCYLLELQDVQNRRKQIREPHLFKRDGNLFAAWAYGQPFDGTWNVAENSVNNSLTRRNKFVQIYPSPGNLLTSDQFFGTYIAISDNYLSSSWAGKIWTINADFTANQLIHDENTSGSPFAFEAFENTYVGVVTTYNSTERNFDAALLRNDHTVHRLGGLAQDCRFAAYNSSLIAGGYHDNNAYISKIDLNTGQSVDVALGSADQSSPYRAIDMNANQYVAVGWDVYLAVADYSGDISAPTVNFTNTETQIVNGSSITLTWDASDNQNQLQRFEIFKEVSGNRSTLATITDTNTRSYPYTVSEGGASEIKFLVLAYDQSGNAGEASLVLPIITHTEDLTSFTLDKSTVALGGPVTFDWTATGTDATTVFTVSIRETGTTQWTQFFQVTGQSTKTMTMDGTPGSFDFMIAAGADSITLTNALTVSGDIPLFDYQQFSAGNSGYYSEPATVTLNWDIQNFQNRDLVSYDLFVKTGAGDYVKLYTGTGTFFNYPVPQGVTSIDWKVTANYLSAQYESTEQSATLTPLQSPAVNLLQLQGNNTASPNVYVTFTPIDGITQYMVTRKALSGEYVELGPITGNNYTDTTVTYNETYKYGILSTYGELRGLTGNTSSIAVSVQEVTSVTILNENFSVTEDTALTLSYQPGPLDAYERYEILFGTSPDALQQFSVTNLRSVIFSSLDYDATYYARVNALDAADGVMASSDLFVFFTPPEPVELPVAPSQLEAGMIGLNQVELRWTDNGDNELGFMIERKEGPTGTYEQIYVTDRSFYTDTHDFVPNSSYFYRVRAYNSGGYSTYSNEAHVVTSIILVTAPNGGETWQVGQTVTITWDSNVNGQVNVLLSRDSGSSWDTIIPGTANDGSETWAVEGETSDHCIIRIDEVNGSLSDTSNNIFFITAAPTISETERSALIALYTGTDGDNWTNNDGWKTAPLHTDGFAMPGTEGTWAGVTVENAGVTAIQLPNNNLNGTLPASLGNLANLTRLELNNNNLTGEIPTAIGQLTNLSILNLSTNQLTGAIPPELGNVTNLQELRLGINELSGELPTGLGGLSNLDLLDFGDNNLTGTVPADFGTFAALRYLYLNDNQLTGGNLSLLGGSSNLVILNLSHNRLTGSIPSGLSVLSNLQRLELHYNQLTGGIPSELGTLANLKVLYLCGNQLEGSIPVSLGNLSNLEYLYLFANQLTGSIPAQLGGLSNLRHLHLHTNLLTGSIPATLGNLGALTALHLSNNQFSGGIPTELGGLTSLEELHLDHNQLTGTIPPALGTLSALRYLYLHRNLLWGTIPAGLGNLSNLASFNISGNQFEGPIPLELTNLTALTQTDTGFGYNKLSTDDDTIRAFLESKHPGWESTQTIPPAGMTANAVSSEAVEVSWQPVAYTADTGYYNVWYGEAAGGPYSYFGRTADKSSGSLTVTGLEPGTTYYFTVTTVTQSHAYNDNQLTSDYSQEVEATTLVPATITVGTPSGGEVWTAGETQTITWSTTGVVNSVNIELSTAGFDGTFTPLAGPVANTGSLQITVPDVNSSQCVVRISDASGSPSDTSDQYFTILPAPSITVGAPNGGEQWQQGTPQLITWSTANITGNVTIRVLKSSGTIPDISWTAPADSGNTGVIWEIPADLPAGDDYTVRIYQGEVEGVSDAPFSITASLANAVHPDFNGDGKVDILWRHYAADGGENFVWYMNGISRTGTDYLPRHAVIDWHIEGTGDFNGDGKTDILWRYTADDANRGQNAVWFMDGVTRSGVATLPALSSLDWEIVDVDDFNNDGKPDILWRCTTACATQGQNVVWYMDGTTRTGAAYLPKQEDLDWRITATGDFNNDGKPDILWRYTADGTSKGQNVAWYMDGITRTGVAMLPNLTGLDWEVVDVADFNGDGKPDILWRNTGSGANRGQNVAWFMDGVTRTGVGTLPTSTDLTWNIEN